MASIPFKSASQSNNQKLTTDRYETKDSNHETVSIPYEQYNFIVLFLVGALVELAQDTALETRSDPDYLITRSLLVSSVNINQKGKDEVLDFFSLHYEWLVDLILNYLS